MKSAIKNICIAATLLAAGMLRAQPAISSARIEGSTWITRATIAPATTPSYTGTAVFRADGTLGGPPRDGHGSDGVAGVWTRVGLQDYAFTFVADTYDSSGNFVQSNVVSGTMHVSDDGLSATGTSLIEILDTTGKVLFKQPSGFPTPFTAVRIVPGSLP